MLGGTTSEGSGRASYTLYFTLTSKVTGYPWALEPSTQVYAIDSPYASKYQLSYTINGVPNYGNQGSITFTWYEVTSTRENFEIKGSLGFNHYKFTSNNQSQEFFTILVTDSSGGSVPGGGTGGTSQDDEVIVFSSYSKNNNKDYLGVGSSLSVAFTEEVLSIYDKRVSVEWYRDGTKVENYGLKNYYLEMDDVGHSISAVVTIDNGPGTISTVYKSKPSEPVVAIAETFQGTIGDDSYVIDHAGDVIVDDGGVDYATVYVDFTLAAGLDIESISADRGLDQDPINITGNELSNDLRGNGRSNHLMGRGGDDILRGWYGTAEFDTLEGGVGNDTYYIDSAADIIIERANEGFDTVYVGNNYALKAANVEKVVLTGYQNFSATGGSSNDEIVGNDYNNTIDGSVGADKMAGGAGDDTYIVDNARDVVVESSNSGSDTVVASVSYALSGNVEALTLTGQAAISATGNMLANHLIGNSAANVLDGGGGADTMSGGLGSDTYVTDGGDILTEAANAGIDTVRSSKSHMLGDNFENLILTGTATSNATGNAFSNTLTGNASANILNGLAGADTLNGLGGADKLIGGGGDDRYYVDTSADLVVEARSAGTDTVYASVSYRLGAGQHIEQLFTTNDATTNALNLTGNEFGNRLKGNAGDNTLNGGLGADTLYGLKGKDTFVFNTTLSSGNVDHLGDFSAVDDTIKLAKSIFTALSSGTLSSGAFKDLSVAGATVDANDRILYNKTTGTLSYDADGSGTKAAVQFAIIDTKATLTASDFFIVS